MDERTSVLKREQVRLGPPLALEQAARGGSPAAASARIVAQDSGAVTIEVQCQCGQRTYVRCEYAAAPPVVRAAAGRAAVETIKTGGGA